MYFLFSLLSTVFCMASFLQDGGFPKPLSKKDEEDCFKRTRAGDEDALSTLVNHNMRLVVHIAKKYVGTMDSEDLISIGSVGLLKAIKTFDYTKGTQFATYASRCIDNEILMTLRANKKNNCCVSLFHPIGTDKEGNEVTLLDTLHDENYDVGKQIEKEYVSQTLREVLQKALTSREYGIISLRYGLDGADPLPQRKVAEKYGISRSYISRIEKKALSKIRAYLEKNNIDLT